MNLRWLVPILILGAMRVSGAWELTLLEPAASLPAGARFTEREVQQDGRAVRIQAVIFSIKKCRIEVIDNEPGRTSLEAALQSAGCFAGVNGGYFHDSFAPVGLMIAQGQRVNGFEKAKLLSGVLVVRGKSASLIRSGELKTADSLTDALQAGPFLLDHGVSAIGLNDEKLARRTVIASDGGDQWALLLFSHVTLAQAARILEDRALFPEARFKSALNLDGGSSSAIWAAVAPKPFSLRGFATVRNFVGIRPL